MSSRQLHQGIYKPQNPAKYRGNIQRVIYRSSWELRFMKWCDQTRAVLEWGSEEVIVPYISPVDGNMHRYFVDFYIKIVDKAGKKKKYLIEIKPSKYTVPPTTPKRRTTRYIQEVRDYAVNQAKWKSATEFALDNNAEFLVLTEQDLGLSA